MTLLWVLAFLVLFVVFLIAISRTLAERNILITELDLATARAVDRFKKLHHIMALDERGNSVGRDARGYLFNRDGDRNTITRLPNGDIAIVDPYGNQVIRYSDGRWAARDAGGTVVSFFTRGELRMLNVLGEELHCASGPTVTVRNAAGAVIDPALSNFQISTEPDQTLVLRVRNGMIVHEKPNVEPVVMDAERRPLPLNAHRSVLLDEVYVPGTGWFRWFARHRPLFGGFYWIGIPFIDRVRWIVTEAYERDENGAGAMVPIRIDALSLRDQYVEFDKQTLQTADGAQAIVKGNMHLRIVDPYKAIVNVDNFVGALRDRYNGMVRSVVGGLKVKELNKLRTSGLSTGDPRIDQEIADLQKVAFDRWGVLVISIGFEDVTPESPEVIAALAKEAISAAEAESTRNVARAQADARKVQGEGDRDYRIAQGEGDKQYRIAQAEADKGYFESVFTTIASVMDGGVEMYQVYKVAEAAQGPATTIILDADILRAVEGYRGTSSRGERETLSNLVMSKFFPEFRKTLEASGLDAAAIDRTMGEMEAKLKGKGARSTGGTP